MSSTEAVEWRLGMRLVLSSCGMETGNKASTKQLWNGDWE